jgi:phasin family protein
MATAGFEQAQANSAPNVATAHTSASNALSFGYDTLGAYARSTEIWAAGLQDLALQSAALARTSIAEANEHLKQLSAAGFVTEAVEMQTRLMRASAEKAVGEANRLADAYIKLTQQAFAPIVANADPADGEPARPGNTSMASSKKHPAARAS